MWGRPLRSACLVAQENILVSAHEFCPIPAVSKGIHMRTPAHFQAFVVATALVALAGCTGGPAVAPKPTTPQDHSSWMMGRVPIAVGTYALRAVHVNHAHHYKSFDACPSTGAIEYISDFNNSVIDIYKGKFAGQGPCGQLAPTGLLNPQGMVVDKLHNLYVSDTGNGNILAFHRGKTAPFRTYTDSTNGSQLPVDVSVSNDGVVFATNIFNPNTGIGSISTFNQATGALIANYSNPNGSFDYYITVQKNGTVYWDDNGPTLWTGSCPLGVCGSFTSVPPPFAFPGELKSADHEDVVILSGDSTGETLTTYEPPNFVTGNACELGNNGAVSFDIDKFDKHVFYDDANGAVEIRYPSCTAVGKVSLSSGALFIGIAVDPAGPLR
jgi:hypothetical protein